MKQQKVIPVVKLTTSERYALERGCKEIARGDYVTLKELEHALESANRKKR